MIAPDMPATRLFPVLEFDPFEYRSDRPSPSQTIDAAPEEWARYWQDCLADAGISGLAPLTGTWVVPVAEILEPSLLRMLVARHVCEPDVTAFLATLPGPFDPDSGHNEDGETIEEHVTPLRGGLVLSGVGAGHADRVGNPWITPECCGDLGNWREWRNAALVETESWQDLWIGHPSAKVCRVDGCLFVQKVHEDGHELGPPVTIAPDELRVAVDVACQELERLCERLLPVLEEPGVAHHVARRLAPRLAGLTVTEFD